MYPQRFLYLLMMAAAVGNAQTDHKLEEVEVTGRRLNLVGEASSASQGVVSQQEIELRPLLRTGDVLELVPGMVVTQHSGTGKANQYFLRGFNLDHGTDFAAFVDGMPVNMRTHGHGQGYIDLNFVIPETIGSLAYKKGPYYADVSDFSSAGSAEMSTAASFENGQAEIGAGENAYYRAVLLDSASLGVGTASYALEMNSYDGPWSDIKEDVQKVNLLLKYGWDIAGGDAALSVMAYDNNWNSADQIPARAVDSGLIDELGSIDDSVGGESSRYSLSASWSDRQSDISVYAIRYKLNLWSNFTYLLDDEINGDQFEQKDERWLYGGRGSYRHEATMAGLAMVNRFGGEFRYDDIQEVGLYKTRGRNRLGPVRSDQVNEWNAGIFGENQLSWTKNVRTVLGLRYDYFDFDVDSLIDRNINNIDLGANSGKAHDDKLALKGSVIYTFSEQWEAYVSAGQGLHSNDARGTTATIDPGDGSPLAPVDPLVDSFGYEVGMRGFWNERLNTSVALWSLKLDSELLFVGDAGNTEASRASERQGVELTTYYRLTDQWTLDMEYAYTDAKFTDSAPEGNQIPGSIEQVLQTGISVDLDSGWFGSLRLRYFGERPLIEDGSVKSDDSTVLNLRAGYRTSRWVLKMDVLNLLDSDDHDVDYFYASRLPGEASGGVEDVHYHVLEPRTVRVYASYLF
ncbi:MAG: TonB-dependent receptor [Pseudomonadales bacterium]|nr:TonB-dependent receptor [Pseudomonadales bacterium]